MGQTYAMRRQLIAGNWKMNGSLVANAELLTGIRQGALLAQINTDIAVCVPFPYLAQVQSLVSGSQIAFGAQDVSQFASGAYTGEVSVAMLQDFGCQYVIVGHSERRAYHGEMDADVAAKTKVAVAAGLVPIVCVGETLAQREQGQMHDVITCQIDCVLNALSQKEAECIVVAYEPVWAIGTGKTATPDMAQEVHALLRARLAQKGAQVAEKVCILYGGSMKPDNARALLQEQDIDGGLIGGAALNAADFLAIIQATNE